MKSVAVQNMFLSVHKLLSIFGFHLQKTTNTQILITQKGLFFSNQINFLQMNVCKHMNNWGLQQICVKYVFMWYRRLLKCEENSNISDYLILMCGFIALKVQNSFQNLWLFYLISFISFSLFFFSGIDILLVYFGESYRLNSKVAMLCRVISNLSSF